MFSCLKLLNVKFKIKYMQNIALKIMLTQLPKKIV